MIILQAPPSHSEFRLQKLVDELSSADLPVKSVHAEYLHVAEASEPLTSEEQSVLEKLNFMGSNLKAVTIRKDCCEWWLPDRERFPHGHPKRLISPTSVG